MLLADNIITALSVRPALGNDIACFIIDSCNFSTALSNALFLIVKSLNEGIAEGDGADAMVKHINPVHKLIGGSREEYYVIHTHGIHIIQADLFRRCREDAFNRIAVIVLIGATDNVATNGCVAKRFENGEIIDRRKNKVTDYGSVYGRRLTEDPEEALRVLRVNRRILRQGRGWVQGSIPLTLFFG